MEGLTLMLLYAVAEMNELIHNLFLVYLYSYQGVPDKKSLHSVAVP